jgi:hypothetical protein
MNTNTLFLLIASLLITTMHGSYAQDNTPSPLFASENPVDIELRFSIREVKKITNDSVYTPSVMKFKNDQGQWDSMKIEIRARGNFRRNNCYFPPLRIRMKKKDNEKTVFAGNKSLKLVVPCQTSKQYDDLILKEYLCYQLYEPVTPYHFHTRMINLTLIDQSSKQPKTYIVKAFFIEDDDKVAKRFNGKIEEDIKLHPLRLKDTVSTTHDFFEYMIANTDWSTAGLHNAKVIKLNPTDYVPLPYDFDMAGLVNAPYSTVSETLPISSVRERIYRGFCRPEPIFQYVRADYLKKESEIMNIISTNSMGIAPKELAGIQKYIGEFYSILKNDRSFKDNILSKCRTN